MSESISKPEPHKLHPLLVRTVVRALISVFQEGQYADKIIEHLLRQNPKAGSRDRAFIAETSYEIVRYYRLYEAVFGRTPESDTDFWQIVGIHLIRMGQPLPDWIEFRGMDKSEIKAQIGHLKTLRTFRESIPDWLDEMAVRELGEPAWEETMHWLNRPARIVLRANRLKTNRLKLQAALRTENVETEPVGGEDSDALVLVRRQGIFSTEAFKKGWFEVQDFSSQLVVPALAPEPGMRVVDACAGGGGKSLHAASLMQNRGSIIALDTLGWKLAELRTRAVRAGASNIETRTIESTKTLKRLHGSADRLLLDVPCSGLGVLRRNPDSKWKMSPEFIDNLRKTQAEILDSYAQICKPGGRLVYATCSILPSENERQVADFLAGENGQSFKLMSQRRILPQDEGFDGFFIAVLDRAGGQKTVPVLTAAAPPPVVEEEKTQAAKPKKTRPAKVPLPQPAVPEKKAVEAKPKVAKTRKSAAAPPPALPEKTAAQDKPKRAKTEKSAAAPAPALPEKTATEAKPKPVKIRKPTGAPRTSKPAK